MHAVADHYKLRVHDYTENQSFEAEPFFDDRTLEEHYGDKEEHLDNYVEAIVRGTTDAIAVDQTQDSFVATATEGTKDV